LSLQKRTLGGLFWTFGQQVGVQGINFVVQLLLARLLLPEAFGLIALIQIFLAIGQSLLDGGMTSSLIRTKDPSQEDYSSVFFINIIASIIVYIILFLFAPLISQAFSLPELMLIIRVYAVSFIIQAFVGVQTTRLTVEMNFKLQTYMQIPSTLIGGLVGIWLALKGLGVWSLVWMQLVTSILFMLQHWFRTNWRPSFVLSKQKLSYHFKFGYKLTLSAILTSIYTNIYSVIIGKLFSVTQLGYYNQANTLRMFPVQNLTVSLQKVTYPLFSTLQDDNIKLKNVFKRITFLVFFIVSPLMLFLIIIASPLFRILLTEKWLPAVPYFQILSLSAIVYPLSIYNLNLLLVKGRSGLHFKLEIIKKVGSVFFLFLIIPYGIYGVVYAAAFSMLLHAFINSYFSGKIINYPLWEQFKNLLPTLIVSTVSFLITYLANYIVLNKIYELNDFSQISILFSLFFMTYVILSIIFNVHCLIEIKNIAKQFIMKFK